MLKQTRQFFEDLLLVSDLSVISASWLLAYHIRFYGGVIPLYTDVPQFKLYLTLLLPIVIIWGFTFKALGLYRGRRIGSHFTEIFVIIKASLLSVLLLVSITFFLRQFNLSRAVIVVFFFINILALTMERALFREFLRFIRKRGYNLRKAIIVGSGNVAAEMAGKIKSHTDTGVKIVGCVADGGKSAAGLKNLGNYDDIRRVIKENDIAHVIFALGIDEHSKLKKALSNIGDEAVDIKVIPDIYELMTLRGGVEEFEGIPIISIQDSPLYGWNVVLKRVFDIVFSLAAIIAGAPLMLVIAAAIKATSKGPVFYAQERMSIGGDTFDMLKFRSMATDAEDETGAVWAKKDDPRRTALGAFLRRTSLDELPQFFNVLKGDMSLVGPRPERPVFIEGFRKNVRNYMLRHKMKAGITGWAQVNGLRGDTDIKERVEHDLYYIENWSLSLDIKIIWLTVWKGFINKNAY